jgi:hypothetical protein
MGGSKKGSKRTAKPACTRLFISDVPFTPEQGHEERFCFCSRARFQESATKPQFVSMSLEEVKRQSVRVVLQNPNAVVKSTQIGESEPTKQEKETILCSVLNSHPATFLRRFGMFLDFDLLVAFETHLNEDDYEARFCVSQLRQAIPLSLSEHLSDAQRMHIAEPTQPPDSGTERWQKRIEPTALNGVPPTSQRVKNRRFRKMQELLNQGEFFSLEAMQLRSPALYDQYFPQLDAGPVSRQSPSARSLLCSESDNMVEISEILLKAYDHDELAKRKKAEESAWTGIKEADDTNAEDAEVENDNTPFDVNIGIQDKYLKGVAGNGEIKGREFDAAEEQDTAMQQADDGEIVMENDVEEDAEAQLREMMKRRFLDGLDNAFFEYGHVDFDWRLDDLEQEQRDTEDAWFDRD